MSPMPHEYTRSNVTVSWKDTSHRERNIFRFDWCFTPPTKGWSLVPWAMLFVGLVFYHLFCVEVSWIAVWGATWESFVYSGPSAPQPAGNGSASTACVGKVEEEEVGEKKKPLGPLNTAWLDAGIPYSSWAEITQCTSSQSWAASQTTSLREIKLPFLITPISCPNMPRRIAFGYYLSNVRKVGHRIITIFTRGNNVNIYKQQLLISSRKIIKVPFLQLSK